MKRFIFSTTYLGKPEAALELLMEPYRLVGKLPFIRKVDVLTRPSERELIVSWETEIDGAVFTWREEVKLSEDRRTVQFRMLKGDFQEYSGTWLINPQQDHTTLTLQVELDWGAPNLSQFITPILEGKAERALRGMVLMIGRLAQRKDREISRLTPRFGFIFHPLDLGLLAEGFQDDDLKQKRPALLAKVMTWIPPFRRGVITGVQSSLGVEIAGDMILMPLLPEQMLTMDDDFVLSRLVEAGRLAEHYGDKIVGLGAYAANIGRKGLHLTKHLRIPVTTGSSYTIAVAHEATLKACEAVGVHLQEATVAVVGATGTIGSICARLMAKEAGRVVLVARNQQRLEDLGHSIKETSRANIVWLTDLDAAIRNADVIMVATNSPTNLIDINKVKSGAVICDISRPRNVSEEVALVRPDLLVLDGGIVRPPGHMETGFSFGLASSLAYACMAETMILTLEGRYESYSLGGNADLAKVEEIGQLAKKHGFALAAMRSYEKEISKQQIESVRRARSKGSRKRRSALSRLP